MTFAAAIERAIEWAMAEDERVVIWGEDVHLLRRNLLARYGPRRVRLAPISESAFLGAAVGAAMAGLRPVVEIMLVDFIGVAFDGLLNHAAKLEAFSGGRWKVPLVVRAACGGGYGDGGQHEQCLWGLLGSVHGLSVVVPSNPADAAGLMLAAIRHDGPVVYLEHKLLSHYWLDYLGTGNRNTVSFDVPLAGVGGEVPEPPVPVAIGQAALVWEGADLSMFSLGVGVHRCLQAAAVLSSKGIGATVVDLRTAVPLDREAILDSAGKTGRVVVVDEDYLRYGLSGEVAAVLAEEKLAVRFGRVATEQTIPYARHLEDQTLPSASRILDAVDRLFNT